MKRRYKAVLGCGLFLFMAAGPGCSDDDGGTTNQNDAAVDAETETDGDIIDAEMPDGELPEAGTGCVGDPVDPPGGNGACCNENTDCIDDFCMGGWCTMPQCVDDSDCDPAVAGGAFEPGTPFHCNTNEFNYYPFCAAGSLQLCGGTGDQPCPSGETCQGAWDEQVTDIADYAIRGACVADEIGAGLVEPGGQCDPYAQYIHHQCRNAGYIFWSCVGRRCTEFCDARNTTNTCQGGLECAGPFWADGGNNNYLLSTGFCTGALCGSMQFSGDPDNDVRIPGLDSACPAGQVCVPFLVTGVDADIFELRCIPDDTSLGGYGNDCENAAKFDLHCSSDICLQNMAEFNSSGQTCEVDEDCAATEVCVEHSNPFLPSRCSPKPDPGFCTTMCRTDADCSDMRGGAAHCVTVNSGTMPNGEESYVTACYAVTEVFDATPVACVRESDCDNTVGEGCVRFGGNTEAKYCQVLSEADTGGTDCTSNPSLCAANEACIDDGSGTSYCTAVLELGDPCNSDPGPNDPLCLGGMCFDVELEPDDGGNPTATYCSSVCTVTADCAANQVCEAIVVENDPAVTTDDVKFGVCRPNTVRVAGTECTAGSCGGSMTCDTVTGRCYTANVPWGSACAGHSDCAQNGFCRDDVTNGLCYLPGCDPANGNADCNDAGSVCSTIYGVGVCLEGCSISTDCSRNSSDGHICDNGACVAP